MFTRRFISIFAGASLLVLFWVAGFWYLSSEQSSLESTVTQETHIESPRLPVEELYPYKIPPKSTFYTILRGLSVEPQTIHKIVEATKPVMDLSRMNPGARFSLNYDNNVLTGLNFRFSAVDKLELRRSGEQWLARKITETVEKRVIAFKGIVTSTLWESAEEASMDPSLVVQLAEIFGWEVDFGREVRANDRWRLTVEQKYVNGEPVGWGNILAAHYENAGQLHSAVYFENNAVTGYFAPDGSSLKRMFLKSPIPYGRITSRFTRKRFHPVLKISRPHLGVDFGAPTGTPVRAVGSGTIMLASWSGGGGRTVKISHNSMYRTSYLHLSRFGAGIRRGTRVNQGQIIGYVGTSGLSTGPHLHFEFWSGGRVVDPLGEKFPAADPVPKDLMSIFRPQAEQRIQQLPGWESVIPSVQAVSAK